MYIDEMSECLQNDLHHFFVGCYFMTLSQDKDLLRK